MHGLGLLRFSGIDRILKVVGYAANGTGNVTTVGYFTDDSYTPFEKCVSTKDGNGLLTKIERSYHGANNAYTYDDLYRLSSKTTTYTTGSTTKQFKTNYSYNTVAGYRKGTRITSEYHYDASSERKYYYYDYYKNGNLKKIRLSSATQSEYVYDEYGRLTEENNYALSRAYKFAYDNGGNITKKETYFITNGTVEKTPTKTDTYDYSSITSGYGQNTAWKDQLKSYNGVAVKYDESGNPLNYLGKVMTWRGRKLMSIDGVAMDYDYNGLRVKKGDKTYYWQSSNLIMERWLKNGAESYIYYYYDESGVCGMNYNGTEYYYRKNIFGDVIAIYDSLGNLQCTYKYDAWGNHKVYNASGSEISAEVLNIGNINPIRYRGYYWDKEFGLYYLQSRYYDPLLGRFISADSVEYLEPDSVSGLNLYVYCNNNPVMNTDPSGHFVISFSAIAISMLIGFAIGATVSGTVAIIEEVYNDGNWNWDASTWDWRSIAKSALGGGVAGAISAIPIGGVIGSLLFGGTASVLGGLISGSVHDLKSGLLAFGIGAGANMIGYGASKIFSKVKANKIFNQGRKAKSLAIQKMQGKSFNMGAKALKGNMRNAFKDTTKEEIEKLIVNTNVLCRYSILSSIVANPLSGWY